MKTESFGSLRDFAQRAPAKAAKHARGVMVAGAEEIRRRFLAYAQALTPVGGSLGPDRHPGLLKRSWKASGAVTATGVAAIGNAAEHAAIINRGRRRGVTPIGSKTRVRAAKGKKLKPNKKARMLGSKQAPQGMTRPTWKRIKAEREAITARAIAVAERGA